MEKVCPSCGESFIPKQRHFWMCPACWKATVFGSAETVAELVKARAERDYWKTRAALLEATPGVPADFAEMLPRLLQLAHPDKHGGSELSTAVTSWLLKTRDRLRAG